MPPSYIFFQEIIHYSQKWVFFAVQAKLFLLNFDDAVPTRSVTRSFVPSPFSALLARCTIF